MVKKFKFFIILATPCLLILALSVSQYSPKEIEAHKNQQETSNSAELANAPSSFNSTGATNQAVTPSKATVLQPAQSASAAPNQLLMIDNMMARIRAGDPNLTYEEQAQFEQDLYAMVASSPALRQQLAQRFQDSVKSGNTLELYMLERALTTSNEGIAEMLPGFTDEIRRQGPLSGYAIQQVAGLYDHLDDKTRREVLGAAMTQVSNASELNEYGGAMNYMIASATNAQHPVSQTSRNAIIAAMERQRQNAQTDDEYFFTSYNLYRLADPAQAVQMASRNLANSLNAGNINAAIAGIRDGRINYDQGLMAQIGSAIMLGRFTPEQLDALSRSMAELQQPRGG